MNATLTEDGKLAYKINVFGHNNLDPPETYVTTGVIADFGAEAVQGRCTRVFEARKVEGDGSLVVLKDVWQDYGHRSEGEIHADLMKELRADAAVDFEEAKKYFLTVLSHGPVMVDGTEDITLGIMRRQNNSDDVERTSLSGAPVPPQPCDEDMTSVGYIPLLRPLRAAPVRPKKVRIHHRMHYRIVFKERCMPLRHIHDFETVFRALIHAMKGARTGDMLGSPIVESNVTSMVALEYLWRYHLVHRDVSVGNILWYNGQGILSDYEYVKKYNDEPGAKCDTRTVSFLWHRRSLLIRHFCTGDGRIHGRRSGPRNEPPRIPRAFSAQSPA